MIQMLTRLLNGFLTSWAVVNLLGTIMFVVGLIIWFGSHSILAALLALTGLYIAVKTD